MSEQFSHPKSHRLIVDLDFVDKPWPGSWKEFERRAPVTMRYLEEILDQGQHKHIRVFDIVSYPSSGSHVDAETMDIMISRAGPSFTVIVGIDYPWDFAVDIAGSMGLDADQTRRFLDWYAKEGPSLDREERDGVSCAHMFHNVGSLSQFRKVVDDALQKCESHFRSESKMVDDKIKEIKALRGARSPGSLHSGPGRHRKRGDVL